jgi:hypothetical protein
VKNFDWSSVEDAYGPATGVPALLAALRSPSPEERAGALASLANGINHQDAITPAAAPASQFLVEIALDASTADRGPLFALLGNLAVGGNHVACLTTGYDTRHPDFESCPDDQMFKATYLAVEAGLPGYLAALADPDTAVRAAVPLILAFLGRKGDAIIGPLGERLALEPDDTARASQAVALGYPAGYLGDAARTEQLVALAEHDQSQLVRACAAFALTFAASSRVPAAGIDALFTLAASTAQVASFPWCDGEVFNLATIGLVAIGVDRRDGALLHRLLTAAHDKPTHARVARAGLHVLFGDQPVGTLTTDQRAFLSTLAAQGFSHAVAEALEERDLPGTAPTLTAWLASGTDLTCCRTSQSKKCKK